MKTKKEEFILFPPIFKFGTECEKMSNEQKSQMFQLYLEIVTNHIKTGHNITSYISIIYDRLARCYHNGIGTDVDKEKAFEMYKLSYAKFSTWCAASWLGCFYQRGSDILLRSASPLIATRNELWRCTINKEKAFEYHKSAYDNGTKEEYILHNDLLTIIKNIAQCYRYGIGTSIDLRKAYELYREYYAMSGKVDELIECNYELGIEQEKLKVIRGDYSKDHPVYMLVQDHINNRRFYTKEILNQMPKELNNIISEFID